MLLQLLVVVVEVTEFIGEDVGVGTEIKSILTEALLKPHNIEAKSVLPGDFVTLREVIELLVLIQTLILVALAGAGAPEDVPLVRVGRGEAMLLKHGPA